jgi:ethanolamine ammonia-lyase small subunit
MNAIARRLRSLTPARVGLQAAGAGLATRELLELAADHALARDAVHAELDAAALLRGLVSRGHPVRLARSRADDRRLYLQRPDLGRELAAECLVDLVPAPGRLVVVVADGLAAAAARHALPLLDHLRALAPPLWNTVPVVIATQARVALGDVIGEAMGAELVVVLIGERPGLSAHDSLGAYLTFSPRRGRTDAERNCVSSIHPGGLPLAVAAWRIHWLVSSALTRGVSGIGLKDESGAPPSDWPLPLPVPPEDRPP